jgi:hypothetical protein
LLPVLKYRKKPTGGMALQIINQGLDSSSLGIFIIFFIF